LLPRFTAAAQFYLEWTQDYTELQQHQPSSYLADEYRQLWTLDLRYRTPQDNLTLSLFSFYSPTDDDYYLRPTAAYRLSDSWLLSAGLNLLGGDLRHTPFAQMEDGSNAFLRLRYRY